MACHKAIHHCINYAAERLFNQINELLIINSRRVELSTVRVHRVSQSLANDLGLLQSLASSSYSSSRTHCSIEVCYAQTCHMHGVACRYDNKRPPPAALHAATTTPAVLSAHGVTDKKAPRKRETSASKCLE